MTTVAAVVPDTAADAATPRLLVVKGGLESESTVRWDRVRNARARITAGYYDRPDVRERVLASVLDDIDE